uniref:F-box domain-containing protein n=1 Tax=Moniliophthora roreri TaxID=221103 RepID=A0A0W0F4D8_MONRR
MSVLLPEILERIIFELPNEKVHERATLGSCSLVCRAFLPSARSRLFHNVHLYQNGVDKFLQLCDHPFETISGNIRRFTISQNLHLVDEPEDKRLQNSPALNRLMTWRSSDGQRTLSTVLSHARTLNLAWIGWWTLSEKAKKRLLEEFQSVTELRLWMTGFDTYGELLALINSFRALESLSLETIRPFRKDRIAESFAATGPSTLPSTLQSISLKDVEDAELIKTLVPCPSLRSFKCHYVNFRDFTLECAAAIGALLSSAGRSLEEFSFTIQAAGMLNEGTILDDRFRPYIDLTKNSNLRKIVLWVEDSNFQIPFLENLTKEHMSPGPHLEILDIHYLPKLTLDWDRLDVVLQAPVFSRLREIRANIFVLFGPEDVVGQPKGWYHAPNKDSKAVQIMKERMTEFQKRLPRCNERGILKLREGYRFFDKWAWTLSLEEDGDIDCTVTATVVVTYEGDNLNGPEADVIDGSAGENQEEPPLPLWPPALPRWGPP